MCCRLVSELLSPSLSSSSSSANLKFLIYLLILLTGVQSIDAFCDEHQWWQEQLNECIPCTVCDSSKSIVLRPCQKHSDTVCGTLDDVELELDWIKAAAVSAHHKQVSSTSISFFLFFSFLSFLLPFSGLLLLTEQYFVRQVQDHQGVIEKSTAAMLMWDWQSLSLALAGLMCLLFFIVAACIYWQHSHYWKKLEQMERRYNAGKRRHFNCGSFNIHLNFVCEIKTQNVEVVLLLFFLFGFQDNSHSQVDISSA